MSRDRAVSNDSTLFSKHRVVTPESCEYGPGGGGVLAEKLGGVVPPASLNPYPIYDQNLRNSLPYL